MKAPPPKVPTINAHLAVVYATSERQVARWKKDHAPLFHIADMTLYFAARKSVPAHLVGLSAQRQKAMQKQLDAIDGRGAKVSQSPRDKKAADPEFLKSLPRGAEHALRRLQEEDARLYAEKEAQTDPLLKAVIAKQWRETLISLRNFENLVEADKRDSGETITRKEIENVLRGVVTWTRRAIETCLNEACVRLLECDEPQQIYTIVAEGFRQSLKNALNASMESQTKTPTWVRDAMVEGL